MDPTMEFEGDAGVAVEEENFDYTNQPAPEPVEQGPVPTSEDSPFVEQGGPDVYNPVTMEQPQQQQPMQYMPPSPRVPQMGTRGIDMAVQYNVEQSQGVPVASVPTIQSAEEAALAGEQIAAQVADIELDIQKQGGSPTLGQIHALDQLHANQAMVNAAGMKHETVGALHKLHAAQEDYALRKQKAEEGRMAQLNEKFMQYEQAMNELDNTTFDSMKFYKENGLMAAIGVLLGGIGQAFHIRATGKDPGNPVLQMVDRLVAMDVQNQKMELQKANRKVGHIENSIGFLRQKLGTEREAEEVYKIAALSKIENELGAIGMKWNLANKQQEVAAIQQGIRNRNAAVQSNLAQNTFALVQQKEQVGYQNAMNRYNEALRQQSMLSAMQAQQRKYSVPGLRIKEGVEILDNDYKEAKAMANDMNRAARSLSIFKQYIDNADSRPGWFARLMSKTGTPTAEVVRMQEAAKELLGILKSERFKNLGAAVTEVEMEKFLVNPTSMGLGFYNRMEETIRNSFGAIPSMLGKYEMDSSQNPDFKVFEEYAQRREKDIRGDQAEQSKYGTVKVR